MLMDKLREAASSGWGSWRKRVPAHASHGDRGVNNPGLLAAAGFSTASPVAWETSELGKPGQSVNPRLWDLL